MSWFDLIKLLLFCAFTFCWIFSPCYSTVRQKLSYTINMSPMAIETKDQSRFSVQPHDFEGRSKRTTQGEKSTTLNNIVTHTKMSKETFYERDEGALEARKQTKIKSVRFDEKVGSTVSKCKCNSKELRKLRQENKRTHMSVKVLLRKLSSRLTVVEQKIQEQNEKFSIYQYGGVEPFDDIITNEIGEEKAMTQKHTVASCPWNCSGNGTCEEGLCHCFSGYYGSACSKAQCPKACSEHGTCDGYGKCLCWIGWSGEDCSVSSCPEECSNHGICDEGVCLCDVGFEGQDCSERSCPNKCSNHGICDHFTGTCSCYGSWRANDCSKRRCPKDCSGHGTCEEEHCICDYTWTGKACNTLQCLNSCSGHGSCKNGTCLCGRKWEGVDCSLRRCPNNCSGVGQCKNGTCMCIDGWGGQDCTKRLCPNMCSEHGKCVDNECDCHEGWVGESCAEVVKPSDLKITDIQPTTIDVSWKKTSSAITGNQVNCIPMEGTANAVYQSAGPNVTRLTIRDLDSGTQYSVLVYAMLEDTLSAPIITSVKTGIDSPSHFTWIRVSDTFAEITWKAPTAEIDRYKVLCSCKEGGAEFSVLSNETSVLITDLSPGESYFVTLYAVKGPDVSKPTDVNFTTSLDAPTEIQFKNVSTNYASVEWSKSKAKVTGYRLSFVKHDAHPSTLNVLEVADTINQVYLTDLESDASYNVTLSSFRNHVRSSRSTSVLQTGLEPPHNVTISKVESTELEISWNSPNNKIKDFRVTLTSKGKHEAVVNMELLSNRTTIKFNHLRAGTSYVVKIYSHDGERESSPLTKNIITNVPSPAGLVALDITNNSFVLRWNASHSNVEKYFIISTNVDTNSKQEIVVTSDQTQAQVFNLSAATLYNSCVWAETALTKSLPSHLLVATSLPSPSNLHSSSGSHGELVITWDPVSEFHDFAIMGAYRIDIKCATCSNDLENSILHFDVPREMTALTVENVKPGQMYHISTSAQSHDSNIPSSQSVSIKHLTPIDAPTEVRATAVSFNAAELSWKSPTANITVFLIEWQDMFHTTEVYSVTLPPNQTSVVISNLIDDMTYDISITALMNNKTSKTVKSLFKTEILIIEPPEYLHATDVTSNAVNLEWVPSLSDGISGYFITCVMKQTSERIFKSTVNRDTFNYTIEELSSDTVFLINLFAVYGKRLSDPAYITVRTDMDSPSNISFSSITDTTLILDWESSNSFVVTYIVTYYKTNMRKNRRDHIIPGKDQKCLLRNLASATTYSVEVFAVGNKTESRPAVSMVTTLPGSVSHLRSPKQGINYILIHWMIPESAGNITGFLVKYSPKEVPGKRKTLEVGVNKRQVEIKGLKPAQKYSVVVYSLRGLDKGEGRTITMPTMVSPVRLLHAMTVDDSSVLIQWEPPKDLNVEQYNVEYRFADGLGAYEHLRTPPHQTDIRLQNLVPDTKYVVQATPVIEGFRGKSRRVLAITAPILRSPTNITITDLTATSTCIKWSSSKDKTVTGYHLEYNSNEEKSERTIRGRKINSLIIVGLQPGTLYYVFITTVRNRTRSYPPTTLRFMTLPTLIPPSDIQVVTRNEKSITLRWKTPPSVAEYYISCKSDAREGLNQIVSSTEKFPQLVIQDLQPGKLYNIDFYSMRNGQLSQNFTSIVARTLGKLLPPANLSIGDIQQRSFTLMWEPQTVNVDGYHLSVFDGKKTIRKRLPSLPTEVTVNKLIPGSEYTVAISATRNNRTTAPTIIVLHTESRLDPPFNLSAQIMGETSATISWNQPLQPHQTVQLNYSTDDQTERKMLMVRGERNTAELFDLKPGTLYHVTLLSMNHNKTSSTTTLSFTTEYIVPPPANLRFLEVNETKLVIAWEATSDRARYYRIKYNSKGKPQRIITVSGLTATFHLEHLKSGETYFITVTALGNGKESEPIAASTSTLLKHLDHFNIDGVTSSSIGLSWVPPLDVERQIVEYSKLKRKGKEYIVSIQLKRQASSTNITGLQPSTDYAFQYIAEKGLQRSHSKRIIATTGLNPPSRFRVYHVSHQSANLSWHQMLSDDVSHYRVELIAGSSTQLYNVSAQRRPGLLLHHLLPNTKYTVTVTSIKGAIRSQTVSLKFKTGLAVYPRPRNCHQIMKNGERANGVYVIYDEASEAMQVPCDLVSDGGGWTIVQRRVNNRESFDRKWDDYLNGFGNASSGFWIGLKAMHFLTSNEDPQQLMITLRYKNQQVNAIYDWFTVSSNVTGYELNATNYSGNAGDSLSYHFGMKFTTSDKDNDEARGRNCADEYDGAWWFRNCHRSNLNGQYGNTKHSQGINWYTFGGFTRSIDFVEMKIRPMSVSRRKRRGSDCQAVR